MATSSNVENVTPLDDASLIEPRHGHRVVAAAIRLEEIRPGLLIVGVRHFDSLMIAQLNALKVTKAFCHDQGFVDNKFQYLTREQAYRVALAAKQFDPDTPGYTGIRGSLFSEDLW